MNIVKFIDKPILFVGKSAIYILAVAIVTCIFLVVFSFAATWLWPSLYGSYSLGDNIYMLEWDGGGRIIVNGTTIKGNTCYGGEQLIPTYENRYDSLGNFAEYVVDAKSDENWIIAKTDNKLDHQKKYYIIDKQHTIETLDAKEIIEKYITSFTDSCEFANKCVSNGIKIKW